MDTNRKLQEQCGHQSQKGDQVSDRQYCYNTKSVGFLASDVEECRWPPPRRVLESPAGCDGIDGKEVFGRLKDFYKTIVWSLRQGLFSL
ncbi:hypothetical protein SUGI_0813000 [Cryptomeria japonica]|nr:hypothetical protein SUGI_0813000 [Cryptomeria japonica]